MGNQFSLLVDDLHRFSADDRLTEFCSRLKDPDVAKWMRVGAKALNPPIRFKRIKPSKKAKKRKRQETDWTPDGDTIKSWLNDKSFWTSQELDLWIQNPTISIVYDFTQAIKSVHGTNAIRKRFLKVFFHDVLDRLHPLDSRRQWRFSNCIRLANLIAKKSSTNHHAEEIALNILKEAIGGLRYNTLTAKHGNKILLVIDGDVDRAILAKGGRSYGQAADAVVQLNLPDRANIINAHNFADKIRATTLSTFLEPLLQEFTQEPVTAKRRKRIRAGRRESKLVQQ